MKRYGLFVLAMILSLTLPFLAACGDHGDTESDSDSVFDEITGEITDYVPEIDPDADSVEGIAISSAEELAKIGRDKNYPLDGDYVLVIDIDLSDYGNWTPIGGAAGISGEYDGDFVFTGTFDGRGHRISGLTINKTVTDQTYWGLFGSVGSKSPDDPAVIKNIVFVNANVTVNTTVNWTAIGVLAGQVNGCAEIDSIALLSGSVVSVSPDAMNIGAGSLVGQFRTLEGREVSNNNIKVTNIFSNVTVSSENSGIDMGGGVLGRIRGSNLGELRNVVYVGHATSEGRAACAIASGDASAESTSGIYFLRGSGDAHNGLGKAVPESDLTGGALKLSDMWTVTVGVYPLLTAVTESPAFSYMDLTSVTYADGESASGIKSDFSLPTTVAGVSITWKSSNEDVITIENGNVQVIRPDGANATVILTAECGGTSRSYRLNVVKSDDQPDTESGTTPAETKPAGTKPSENNPADSKPAETNTYTSTANPTPEYKNPHFVTTYVEAGKPIELGGYASGTSFEWIIKNQATGKSRTVRTTKPSLTLQADDAESLITVRASGYKDISIYYSTLPIIYVTSKTQYSRASWDYYDVEMQVTAGSKYADLLYDGKAQFHVRGNSTGGLHKKPFKVKLDKKANLLGIDKEGKSKHWVLLANARDPSLLRNKVLMDFSGAIGMDVFMSSENVTLIYNGEYCGVYQLTEHVRVGETRVNVFDWENYAEDVADTIAEKLRKAGSIGNAEATRVSDEIEAQMTTDWSWMSSGRITYRGKTYKFTDLGLPALPKQTGGFLLEMDFYHLGSVEVASVQTAYAQPLYFNTPEPVGWDSITSFWSTALYDYARRYVQSFEYAVHSDDFIFRNSDTHYFVGNWWDKWAPREYYESDYRDADNDGKHYSELFDMDSLVQNFIFCEIAMNWDSMKNSFFVYKDVDGLAKIGPQWDFDWAWGNDTWPLAYGMNTWDPTEWHCRDYNFMSEQYYQEVQWNCLLIRDPYFLTKVWESWHNMRNNQIEGLVGKNGTINTYAEYIRKAAAANDAKWAEADAFGITFSYSLSRLKDFVSTRMTWLDKQFVSLDTFVNSLGVYHASNNITVSTSTSGSNTKITAKVSDSNIKYINFQINGTTMIEAEVKGGTATVTVANSKLNSKGYNCVVAYARNSRREYVIDPMWSEAGNYNQVVSNYSSFKIK